VLRRKQVNVIQDNFGLRENVATSDRWPGEGTWKIRSWSLETGKNTLSRQNSRYKDSVYFKEN
jgi:hypothetical protein